MVAVKSLILDVLKPHQPNALEFASALAELGDGLEVTLTVTAVDEKTESVEVELSAGHIDFERISQRIKELGASIHSIDQAKVIGRGTKNGNGL